MAQKKKEPPMGPHPFSQVGRVLGLVLSLNLFVCVGKLLLGQSVNSLSMVADGFHSLMDALGDGVGLASLWIAFKPPDKGHPYGHQKFEILASLGIVVLMGVTGVEVAVDAFRRWGRPADLPHPDDFSFLFMILTMGINAWISWYESRKGRMFQNFLLTADSVHTGSDILASALVIGALVGARWGLGWVDLAAALFVVGVVTKVAWGILRQAQEVLVDHIMVDPQSVAKVVRAVPGVVSCHRIRSRGMPGRIFVDLHLQVSPRSPTLKAHAVTHQVMEAVKKAVPGVREVFVHTEPAGPLSRDLRDGPLH